MPLLEKPKYSNLGDLSFPCFVLASKYKKNPFMIAMEVAAKFNPAPDGFSKVQATGGYVNFFFDGSSMAHDIIKKILSENKKYGSSEKKRKVMVEFSQANTHKAFHVGH